MQRRVHSIIRLMPFFILALNLLCIFLPKSMHRAYDYLGNILGYSLLTNIVMLHYSYCHRFCTYIKLSIWGLISMNILDLVDIANNDFHFIVNLPYYYIYSLLSGFLFFGLATFYMFIEHGRNRRK